MANDMRAGTGLSGGTVDAMLRILPFALYILFLAGASIAAWFFDGADLRWLYAVKVACVGALLMAFCGRYGELQTLPRQSLHWVAAGLVGAALFVVWINLDAPWASLGAGKSGVGFDPRDGRGEAIWSLVAARLVGAVIVVPVMEELFWRSLVMRWIENQRFLAVAPEAVGWRALLLSSLAFGFEHDLWLAGIVAGVGYGWLYRRFASLWAPIVAHATTNLLLGVWVVATGNWQFW